MPKDFQERAEDINLIINVLTKAKIDLFNDKLGDYQKDLDIALRGIQHLEEHYKNNLMETV